ncbi:MAG TPA: 8-oxo-dGTP diphosphatase MutT [Acetobacteraceae bacterium]|jgi:8-oxo-dGTP diphosphatase
MTTAGKAQPRTARRRKSARSAGLPLDPPDPEQGFAPLATERLVLRPLRPADAESLYRLASDWEVTRMLAMVPCPYPRELADGWIVSTGEQLTAGSAYHLAITGQEVDREVLVGVVGLRVDRATRSGHLGYWVGRHFWGHGVATEAAGKLVRWGFANLDLDRISADVATDNPASAAVLRRIGFRQTGEGEEHFASRKAQHPVWRFEANRDDVFGQPDPGPAIDAEDTEPGAKRLLLVAACALVDVDGRVLLARRPEGKTMAGLWEFPGGKLHPGETPEAALIRELREELGIDVTAACLAPFAFASHEYQRFHLLMPLFLCRRWKGIPTAREHQTLAWVRPQKLAEYEMPPADKPLIPLLRDFL